MNTDAASEARIQHNRDVATARQIVRHVVADEGRQAVRELIALTDTLGALAARDWLVELTVLADLANNKKNALTRH